MNENLLVRWLVFLLVFNIIAVQCHLEKREVHRIIIKEGSRKPRSHRHKNSQHYRHNVKHGKDHSLENYDNSFESDKGYEVITLNKPTHNSHSHSERHKQHWIPYHSSENREVNFLSNFQDSDSGKRQPATWSHSLYGDEDNFPDFTSDQKFVELRENPLRTVKVFAIPEKYLPFLNKGGYDVNEEVNEDYSYGKLREKKNSNKGRKRNHAGRQRSKESVFV